jgi:hypothetical protein
MTTIAGAGANSQDVLARMAGLVRSLRPRIEQDRVAGPGEIDALMHRAPGRGRSTRQLHRRSLGRHSLVAPHLTATGVHHRP